MRLGFKKLTLAGNGAGLDELLAVCWRLRQAGYPDLIRLEQTAKWKGDTREGHQARAFSTGYLRAVLQAIQDEVRSTSF